MFKHTNYTVYLIAFKNKNCVFEAIECSKNPENLCLINCKILKKNGKIFFSTHKNLCVLKIGFSVFLKLPDFGDTINK
jgi:hypothetical protein